MELCLMVTISSNSQTGMLFHAQGSGRVKYSVALIKYSTFYIYDSPWALKLAVGSGTVYWW